MCKNFTLLISGVARIFWVLGRFPAKLFWDMGCIGQLKIDWAATGSCQKFIAISESMLFQGNLSLPY
jgi:precorrin-6B methylase 2